MLPRSRPRSRTNAPTPRAPTQPQADPLPLTHRAAVAATRALRVAYPVQRALFRVHDWAFRASGGRVGRRFARRPCLVLTTTGRVTGQPRTVVLVYVEHGDAWVVVASNMGSHHAPAWLANLRADPAAIVTIGGRSVAVRAREAGTAEHDALWPVVDRAGYGQYGRYQAIAARAIPLVILEPT